MHVLYIGFTQIFIIAFFPIGFPISSVADKTSAMTLNFTTLSGWSVPKGSGSARLNVMDPDPTERTL